jgi:hypothetical protein
VNTTTTKSLVFVFGSNLAGRHGKGAALYARQNHGAIYGQGEGLQGQSYAIPTKDAKLRVLSLSEIQNYVNAFKLFAETHSSMDFEVTRIGCGLAGYTDNQIAPMFSKCPPNVHLPKMWMEKKEEKIQASTTETKASAILKRRFPPLGDLSHSSWEKIPHYMQGGIVSYVLRGVEPGDFLSAVIKGKLFDAASTADLTNQKLLSDYAKFFWNNTPSNCWGWEEVIYAWRKELEDMNKAADTEEST